MFDLKKSLRTHELLFLANNISSFEELQDGNSLYEVMEVEPEMLKYINCAFGVGCLKERYHRQVMQQVFERFEFVLKRYGLNNVQQIAYLSAVTVVEEELNLELYEFYGKISMSTYKKYNEYCDLCGENPIFSSEEEFLKHYYKIL